MNKNILFGFGLLTLLSIAFLLTDGENTNTRRRYKWTTRRFIRRRPTKPSTGNVQVRINPANPKQNSRTQNEIQDFDNREGVEEFWREMYENGKTFRFNFYHFGLSDIKSSESRESGARGKLLIVSIDELSAWTCTLVSIDLSTIYFFIYSFIYIFIYLFIYLVIYLFIYLFIYYWV